MEDKLVILEDALRDMYVRTVWSHKIQEKQADIYQNRYRRMETANITCASLASISILSTIFTDQLWLKIISAFLSFVTVFITAYFRSFDLIALAKTHKDAANKLLTIRNEITGLLASIKMKEKSLLELEDEYHKLISMGNKIYNAAPNTTDQAVKKAKEALHVKGDNTFTIEEIDSYLPPALRKGDK